MEEVIVPTAEELAAEEASKKIPSLDEAKAKVIEEFGFDAEVDADKIEKLANKEIDNAKKLFTAVGQKIKHREAAAKLRADAKDAGTKIDTSAMSPQEIIALGKADLPAEDVEEVIEFAKLKKITVVEALVAPMMKTYLEDKAEKRRTAEAAESGGGRGTNKVDGVALLAKAEATGEVPDTVEGMQGLFGARINRKLGKK